MTNSKKNRGGLATIFFALGFSYFAFVIEKSLPSVILVSV